MKLISYDGVAAITTDEVADAILDLAVAIARFNRYEQVAVPVVVAGVREQLTLMLGPTIHVSSLTASTVAPVEIEGASETAEEIRQRAQAISDPLHAVDGLPDVWSA